MFDLSLGRLLSLIVHFVGNKLKDDELLVSQNESGLDAPTAKIVRDYVFSAFKTPSFYRFAHPADLELNNVFSIARGVFKEPSTFVEKSGDLAKMLHDASQHPQIKSGELMVMYFDKIRFGTIEAPAIGIFKSEKKQPFLFTESQDRVIDLFSYQGISPARVDKACLIFNDSEEDGYQVLAVDNINKGEEARYWFDDFLKIKPRSTGFAKTASMISLTKNFIDTDLNEEGALERDKAIDLLNRSKDYFQESEQFDFEDFSNKVFEDKGVGDRFREYSVARDKDELNFSDSFEISPEAVKKQQRVFKSVLKLDRNFHVYIHGNRDMIEKGTDGEGRKYYKLFYEEES